MRDPGQIDTIVNALRDAWKQAPDERFGQFIDNLNMGEFTLPEWDQFEEYNAYRSAFRLRDDDKWLKAIEKRFALESAE